MRYPKINSLWMRDEKTKALIVGDYAREEFSNVRRWDVTEKVDGTNIRITFLQRDGQRTQPCIQGKTDAAVIPAFLLESLQPLASWDLFDKAFHHETKDFEVVLFGEGYGEKIQANGGKYRRGTGLILFDVVMGHWWMPRVLVGRVAKAFGVSAVPDLGIMSEEEIVAFVKSKPLSRCSEAPRAMEGIVARASCGICDSRGTPVMFKLKAKDFV